MRRPQTLQVDHTLSDLYKPRQSEAEIQKEINLRLSALVTAHEDGSEAERGEWEWCGWECREGG